MLLLIDNYDSFTYNLVHYLGELGAEVEIYRNDALSADDALALNPRGIVLSPGPCNPDRAGICLELIEKNTGGIPLLGVCLGHQAIGQVFGASVIGAKEIKHGKTSALFHKNRGLFNGFEQGYAVTRYHSLVLDENHFPNVLNIDAWCVTDDGEKEIMGISHNALPIWGVQFHPESLLTEYGHDILNAFLNA